MTEEEILEAREEKGREEGLVEGLEKGREEKVREIALRMIRNKKDIEEVKDLLGVDDKFFVDLRKAVEMNLF
jgi:predicted transposase YdaD